MPLILSSKQFAEYHRHLAQRFAPTILRGVELGAKRAIPYLVDRTRKAVPANPGGIGTGGAVDTGGFIRSWKVAKMATGAAILNGHPAAPVIEYGRRKGSKFPPREALIPWIMRKLINKPKQKKRRFGARPTREQAAAEQDARRLKAAIARVAAHDRKHGPKPQPRESGPRYERSAPGARPKRVYSAREQAERLYFPIARAIARRGLIGRKILTAREAQDEISRLVHVQVAEELRKEAAKR